jgi:hypothetical protein
MKNIKLLLLLIISLVILTFNASYASYDRRLYVEKFYTMQLLNKYKDGKIEFENKIELLTELNYNDKNYPVNSVRTYNYKEINGIIYAITLKDNYLDIMNDEIIPLKNTKDLKDNELIYVLTLAKDQDGINFSGKIRLESMKNLIEFELKHWEIDFKSAPFQDIEKHNAVVHWVSDIQTIFILNL